MMKLKHITLPVMLCFTLIGCAKTNPLLEHHQDFVGEWKTESSTLQIEKNGDAKFVQQHKSEIKTAESDTKSSSISDIKAPLSALNNQHIAIGQGHFGKEFKVDKAPFKQDGKWQMILDGQTYTRK